jgi:hypothetical protein
MERKRRWRRTRVDEGEKSQVGTYPGWKGNGGIVRMKKVKEKNQSGFEVAGEIYSRVPESEWPSKSPLASCPLRRWVLTELDELGIDGTGRKGRRSWGDGEKEEQIEEMGDG